MSQKSTKMDELSTLLDNDCVILDGNCDCPNPVLESCKKYPKEKRNDTRIMASAITI